jgi:hypothetical protein
MRGRAGREAEEPALRGGGGREARLDPVRWRRPGRSALLRSAVVTVLVATAAVLMWAGPGTGGASSPLVAASPVRPSPAAAQSPGRPAVPAGSIGVPIRLAEPTALRLIHPGDHVDVFRVPETGESPQAIATAALVLGVTGAEDPTSGGLLLALTPAEARRTVTAPGGGYAVLIRPDG